jgi:hypothetical protein
MVIYTLVKYKDVYTLSNQGAAFSYKVYRKDCVENTLLYENTLATSASVVLPITDDGKFLLQMGASDDATTVSVTIVYYKNFLTSIVKSTKQELCNCKCKDCDCEEPKESECIGTKWSVYTHLTGIGVDEITDISPYFDCRFNEGITCNSREKFFYGKDDCKFLTTDNIMLYYLGIYYAELMAALDAEETAYIKLKFKSAEILPCISRKGIDLVTIQAYL